MNYPVLFWITLLLVYATPLAVNLLTRYQINHQVPQISSFFSALNALGCVMALAMLVLYFVTKQYPRLLIIVLLACYVFSTIYLIAQVIKTKKQLSLKK